MAKLYTSLHNIFSRDSRKETYLYIFLWLLLFLTPLLSIYVRLSHSASSSEFPWTELLLVWRQYAIFLAMFLVHNYLLAPLLVYRQRRLPYFSSLAVMLSVFILLQCANRPLHGMDGHHRPGPRPAFTEQGPPPDLPDFKRHDRTDGPHHNGNGPHRPDNGPHRPDGGPHRLNDKHKPPIILGEHDIVTTIIFILMLGMNLGVKLYFRQQKDHDRLMKLENDNLEQQLEYLKYQINPHFLMNTLNNIHALVDIDQEQAKETIVELSKIMRFVLYEGSKQKVPLRQELIFLENYIELMRMRYSNQVSISVSMPDMIPDREIPPLLLITFVENAFKHGVSYRQKSFIDIDISISQPQESTTTQLVFRCTNSKLPLAEDSHGGVGLQNARRRLELLYGNSYTLNIANEDDTYTVTLNIPI